MHFLWRAVWVKMLFEKAPGQWKEEDHFLWGLSDQVTMINKIVKMRKVELSWHRQALCDVSYSYTW